jgi:hypothetical protein
MKVNELFEATKKLTDSQRRYQQNKNIAKMKAKSAKRKEQRANPLTDEDKRKLYDVLSANGPDVDMYSPKFGRLAGEAKRAGVLDDKKKIFKWLEDKGMFGPVSDRLRAPGDKYYPPMKEGKDFPSDTVCKCGHRLGQHVSRFEAAKGGERRCTCGDCSCKEFRKDLKESTDAKRGPKVHDFTHIHEPHTSNAYDETQTNDDIKDGDVFHLGGDKTGVMVQAWPVEVTGNHNKESGFHTLGNGKTWDTLDDGKYKKSAELAHATAKKHGAKAR